MRTETTTCVHISIRDIGSIREIREVEELQKEVWGFSDRDIVPATQLLPARDLGGALLGAFDGPTLVGFVYGFLGLKSGQHVLHSEMLAVKRAYRNLGIGYRLKLAQREQTLKKGIRRITWTFDPLQTANAYFNLTKLGAISDAYLTNYYGESTSSFLHRNGTDRLWVTWNLESTRVVRRLVEASVPAIASAEVPTLLTPGPDGRPVLHLDGALLAGDTLLLRLPAAGSIPCDHSPLAGDWRETVREAFVWALGAGYIAAEFCRDHADPHSGAYYLVRVARESLDGGSRSLESNS